MTTHAIFARKVQTERLSTVDFAHFIARRILRSSDKDGNDRLSRPIVSIAVVGIVLGMAVMIVTVGITRGFQREVRAKVTGAGGHLQITSLRQTDPRETPRIPRDQTFYPWLDTVPGVAHIQIHASRSGIIETGEEIQGVVVKGVGTDHDWTFLKKHLVDGELPAIGDPKRPIDLLLSRYLADRLRIGANDTITVYLIKGREDIRPRRFRISGLYETGLEQLDHQLVYVDIEHLQRFAQWGLKAELLVHDTVSPKGIRIEGLAFGSDRTHNFAWPDHSLHGKGPHWLELTGDTLIVLEVSDANGTIPDTAWVRISPLPGTQPSPWLRRDQVELAFGGSGGSHTKYVGGFEVLLEPSEDFMAMNDLVYQDHLGFDLRSRSVSERFPEIFAWLELLDTNVVVVVLLMVIVAIINMTSALLIIILERTSMIGMLKALGATNGMIRRIFLIDAAYIIGAGIVMGDLVGIGLCLLQQHLELVTLPVESYYVDAVPVDIEPWPILLLNTGTMLVCLVALLLPSSLVSRISPVRAIRFD
jgi:lipoprotein-releasing system permease protein